MLPEIVYIIAAVCHAANKQYCELLGDFSQPNWVEAPDWQQQSAVDGVLFHIKNPEASASASHDSWLANKEKEGWKYGPVKDPEALEHPCIVPFTDLPKNQQAKDFIFKSIVHGFIEAGLTEGL